MDQIERFIGDENIVRFVEQLRTATDPDRQHTLRRLLIEEERRFSATEERLGMVERQLTEGAAHIARLTNVVAKTKFDRHDSARAESNLQVAVMIQELFQDFRSDIHEKWERREGSA